MKKNLIMNSDSYKLSHWLQYPPKTKYNFSYLESRGCERDYTESVFFGLQYIIKEYLAKGITMEDVEKAKKKAEAHGEPFNYEGWKKIVEVHHGKFPLRIRAVPEGTVVPLKNVLMTVESTDPELHWLTSYVETMLERVWYPMTVATQSYYLKKLIYSYLEKTADNPDAEISFKLHDFGSRGVSSQESAMIGGAAHLVNFKGTDTLDALDFLEEYYHEYCAGFSIPAGEHSTFSSWGQDREIDAYRNMLKQYGREGSLLAVVSDTWDIYNACEKIWGEELKQEVIDSGATVVIRPDSGDPTQVLCGIDTKDLEKGYGEEEGRYWVRGKYTSHKDQWGAEVWGTYERVREVSQNELKGILQILADKFGYTVNSKGYKVLNNVRVIQGDGVNPDSIKQILETMKKMKFSATNIAFGMGGALLQKVDRDTLKVAYKCSATINDRGQVEVYKDPITDKGKKSKKGRLDLIKVDGQFQTVVLEGMELQHKDSELQTYYWNGEIMMDDNFEAIRKRAK